jgi:hypothetical protein
MHAECDKWNAANPVGAKVLCWPGVADVRVPGKPAETVSEAMILGGHTAGIYVSPGGFMALSHVRVDDAAAGP